MFDGPPGLDYALAIATIASLVLAGRPGASTSRRVLAIALVVLVPIAGIVLAMVVRRVKGGAVPYEPPPEHSVSRLSVADVARLGEMPPILDRLLASDPSERLEALVALSSAGDAAAVRVLRWALEHGPADVVLDVALTLEEIELRADTRLAAVRERLTAPCTAELALQAAQASASSVLNGIADPLTVTALADEARAHYLAALEAAPERADEIEEQLARLELAAGRPGDAFEIVERLLRRGAGDRSRLAHLRDDAAFAARAFDELTFVPCALELPIELTARKLQTVLS